MFILVVGGGKVGYHLTKALKGMDHEVVLMEKNAEKAKRLEAELGSMVIGRDGCEGRWLLHAGVTRAELIVAVTGDDEDNLIICQLAGILSNGRTRTIARINNPKNASVFRRLGVANTVSSTDLILSMIEQDVPAGAIVHLLRLDESHLELVEIKIAEGSRAASSKLRDLDLTRLGCTICLVIRGRETVLPEPDLELHGEDMLVALIRTEQEAAVRHYLTEPEVVVKLR